MTASFEDSLIDQYLIQIPHSMLEWQATEMRGKAHAFSSLISAWVGEDTIRTDSLLQAGPNCATLSGVGHWSFAMRILVGALFLVLALASLSSAQDFVPQAARSRHSVDLISVGSPSSAGCVVKSYFAVMDLGPDSPVLIGLLLGAASSEKREGAAGILVQEGTIHKDGRQSLDSIRIRSFRVSAKDATLLVSRVKKDRDLGGMYVGDPPMGDVLGILRAYQAGEEILVEFEGAADGFPSEFRFVPELEVLDETFLAACTEALVVGH